MLAAEQMAEYVVEKQDLYFHGESPFGLDTKNGKDR
ncbi:hypothetical protein DESC_10007 [Desulfosarcina cetonica]|nr:hypothetical protein DESC_10007 [Desulfosarcina cetonica]